MCVCVCVCVCCVFSVFTVYSVVLILKKVITSSESVKRCLPPFAQAIPDDYPQMITNWNVLGKTLKKLSVSTASHGPSEFSAPSLPSFRRGGPLHPH